MWTKVAFCQSSVLGMLSSVSDFDITFHSHSFIEGHSLMSELWQCIILV